MMDPVDEYVVHGRRAEKLSSNLLTTMPMKDVLGAKVEKVIVSEDILRRT